ncbi:MAG: hypothetical protein H0V01_05090 [Bacteroidetes bacterium]|nr:hypothetical protein [Bacteroidota bacterium]HET6244792.1 hypothetical protein [Bacteroidia bacterium]
MVKAAIFMALVFIGINSNAQEILLEQNPGKDTIPSQQGPNLKHYSHMYLGLGFIVGPSMGAGSAIRYGNSTDFNFGYRYKRKVANFYAVGFDLAYGLTSFNIKQQIQKTLPNSVLHDNEKINFNHLGALIYNRFNIGKRGNHIGNFIDVAAYGNWEFAIRHIYNDKNKTPNESNAKLTKVVNKNLTYTNPFNYGLQARIGLNRYVFYSSYRMSSLFKSRFMYPELPLLTIGMQISLHG